MAITKPIEQEEKLLIQKAYRRMVRSIKSEVHPEDKVNIRKAYEMAVSAHANQRRKSGEPYVMHPIEVSRICAREIGLGPTAIICALLHDVVEDTPVTLEEIQEEFGEKIAKIVDGLTKLDGTYSYNSPQAENFKKVVSTLIEDVRVVLIKMADRLHNLRTIGSMPHEKQLKIAAETNYIYSPLAHRLGLYNMRVEFQDLCMRITDPDAYREISEKLQQSKNERSRYIQEFIRPLRKKLDQLGMPYRITGRPKSISSIWNKIKTKNVSFDEIYDLFAIRVIVDVPLDLEKNICWQIYSIVTDVHPPIPERLKDWITTPKSNGYESLHTTVIGPKGRYVEIQIRSERMDEIAERGFAAHWKYKGIKNQKNVYEMWLDNIRDILEDEVHDDPVEFLSDFKTNLFKEEVYVYTPNGDMKILPKGATALDFAFSIHTDLGYHASAIKVNNKLVPMGYELKNGDQIQVTTNKNQKPNDDWLKMVITGKAKSKIRSSLKEEKRKKGEFGKESLARKFKNLKVDFDKGVETLIREYDYKNHPELFYDIYTGEFDLSELKKFSIENHQLIKKKEDQVQQLARIEKGEKAPADDSVHRSGQSKILVNGEPADQYEFSLATCCNPVQGDPIFAFFTAGAGLKIHRTNCPNSTHLMANYGYRVMKAEWVDKIGDSFQVNLIITGVDDGPGVIERLTNTVSSKLGLNIRAFSIEGTGGYFEGKMSVLVMNKNQMELAIRTLKNLKGISNVIRES
ncbi:MAG: bifunctional (p)ppGpp synthetase/guanosine-3',5'-bis(diphosphate) 3'-pyrophosphohydrolase [Saprospirales bacterium]|nr:MAG: bifunctional (p)ppGpp synthetase/guanosine-3',5'-bis(diphosphate) 3'-pyrophosphohydrolase [Saprospirales bacterium]